MRRVRAETLEVRDLTFTREVSSDLYWLSRLHECGDAIYTNVSDERGRPYFRGEGVGVVDYQGEGRPQEFGDLIHKQKRMGWYDVC